VTNRYQDLGACSTGPTAGAKVDELIRTGDGWKELTDLSTVARPCNEAARPQARPHIRIHQRRPRGTTAPKVDSTGRNGRADGDK
jgi:hypothetical protein